MKRDKQVEDVKREINKIHSKLSVLASLKQTKKRRSADAVGFQHTVQDVR
jgi:hypothetical protein